MLRCPAAPLACSVHQPLRLAAAAERRRRGARCLPRSAAGAAPCCSATRVGPQHRPPAGWTQSLQCNIGWGATSRSMCRHGPSMSTHPNVPAWHRPASGSSDVCSQRSQHKAQPPCLTPTCLAAHGGSMEHLGPLVRDNGDLRWRSQVVRVSALLPASCNRKVIRPAALGFCCNGKALSQLIWVCRCAPARQQAASLLLTTPPNPPQRTPPLTSAPASSSSFTISGWPRWQARKSAEPRRLVLTLTSTFGAASRRRQMSRWPAGEGSREGQGHIQAGAGRAHTRGT